ncbi:DUF3237 family protein [Sorangium sp. So ce1000]|uniref:DUF3237 family protein n=1 Tax=Sorangium sp. So ce1000 TaxID=3133325 RepID=UPI003F5E69F8
MSSPGIRLAAVLAAHDQHPALFTEPVSHGSSLSVGTSERGTRNIIPSTGGTVTGGTLLSGLSGAVLPGGGTTSASDRARRWTPGTCCPRATASSSW